ncbi:MAG: TCP-1/cpn60 chaperonin family protein, partial [Elainellaceae cyanobacterium]
IALDNAASSLVSVLLNGELKSAYYLGYEIVLNACYAPVMQISSNAGIEYSPNPVVGEGMNVKTGEIVNMMDAGIIDPKKVTRCAIENAASVASTFLTTEAVIAVNR